MAKAMELPTTDHTYPDLFFQNFLIDKMKAWFPEHDFTMKDLKAKLGLDLDDLKIVAKQFREFDADGDGSVSAIEFKTALKLGAVGGGDAKYANYHKRLFDFFATTYEGGMEPRFELRDYVDALALASDSGAVEDQINYAFVLYDTEMDGKVSIETLVKSFADKEGLFKHFDNDKDGKLTFEEFKEALEKDDEVVKLIMGQLSNSLKTSIDAVIAARKTEVQAVETTQSKVDGEGVKADEIKIEVGGEKA